MTEPLFVYAGRLAAQLATRDGRTCVRDVMAAAGDEGRPMSRQTARVGLWRAFHQAWPNLTMHEGSPLVLVDRPQDD